MPRERVLEMTFATLSFALCLALPFGCGGGGDDAVANHCLGSPPAHAPVSLGGTGMSDGELHQAELVFQYVNVERVAVGLPPLAWRDDLAEVAYQHSLWQRDENGGLTHDGPGTCVGDYCLVQRMELYGGFRQGKDYGWVGENVAEGQQDAQQVMCGPYSWMGSPGHYANIVRPEFTEMGVAVAYPANGSPGPIWTQVFIGPP